MSQVHLDEPCCGLGRGETDLRRAGLTGAPLDSLHEHGADAASLNFGLDGELGETRDVGALEPPDPCRSADAAAGGLCGGLEKDRADDFAEVGRDVALADADAFARDFFRLKRRQRLDPTVGVLFVRAVQQARDMSERIIGLKEPDTDFAGESLAGSVHRRIIRGVCARMAQHAPGAAWNSYPLTMSHPSPAEHLRPAKPIPAQGALQVRVRYCECDPMGVAHHAAYVPWLEMGRTELLRDAGISYAQLEAAGAFLVIVKLEVSYRRPAFYDDLVEVRTRVVGGSRVKIRHEYEVVRVESAGGHLGAGGITPGSVAHPGEILAVGQSLLASVDRTGRPAPMPEWLVPVEPPAV